MDPKTKTKPGRPKSKVNNTENKGHEKFTRASSKK